MEFHDLSTRGARDVLAHSFASLVRTASANPAVGVAKAGKLVRYLSDYQAIVQAGKKRLELVSTVPLRASGKSGSEPISLHLHHHGGSFIVARPVQPVSIAEDLSGGVAVGTEGVRLIMQGANARGASVDGKSVFFANVARDEDASVAPTIKGAEMFAVLRSRLSPELLRYRVVMPRGAELRAVDAGASVSLYGRELARIPSPSARDAQGQSVPVHMTVSGDELFLAVTHRRQDVAYPLLVDPELGSGASLKGWQYYTIGSGVSGPYPGTIEASTGEHTHDAGIWLWSRQNKASSIKSLAFYGLSVSASPENRWWIAVGSAAVAEKGGELTGINSSWRWGGFSDEGAPPAEVVAEKMVSWETSPAAIYLESEPYPSEHQKGAASFSVSGMLATIELNGRTTVVNPLGESTSAASPEENYGQENPGAPALDHRCLLGHPVDCATGNQIESQTDLAIRGHGLGLNVSRTYNSQLAVKLTSPGIYGYGWTGPYSAHLTLGESCSGFHCVETATVHQDNGSIVRFELAPNKTYIAGSWVQATLAKEGSDYVYTLPNQTTLHFNGAGELLREADINGYSTTINRNLEGRLESVTDPSGRSLTFAYNESGEVESIADPMGNIIKYNYESGNLTSVTEPGEPEPRWRFKYDSSHQLTTETDALGNAVTTEYDSSHRAILQKDALERTRKWKYSSTESGTETFIAEPNGSTTVEQFNDAGLPTSVTHASGTSLAATTTYEYDPAYNLLARTDPNGHTMKYTYDATGNLLTRTDALGHETRWTYDSRHLIETETTPDGEKTTYERDSAGEPKSISRAAPGKQTQVTTNTYGGGTLEAMTDPLGRKWVYGYDGYGDRSEEVDPEGNTRRYWYDQDSREIRSVSPLGTLEGAEESSYETTIERDAQGRTTLVTNPLGHTTEYAYDADGNRESQRDANGNRTKYVYDADNEPIKVEEPNGTVTETGYDSDGQVVSQTDGNKHTSKYARDALERVIEVIDPDERKTAKAYDKAGNLTKLTDPSKRVTSYTYDSVNRLTGTSYSDGKTHAVEYEYNGDDYITHMIDGTGTTSYIYDQLDRLTESVNGHKESTKYEYDLANELTKITYPNKQFVTRTYDADGRLQTVTDWLTHQTKFTYDTDSNLIGTTFPAGTGDQDKYAYNDADQMSAVTMTKGAETLASLVYGRDNNGQIKVTTSKGLPGEEKATDTYDSNNRLTKAGTVVYGYDVADNPLKLGSGTYAYDNADQLKIGNGVKYAFNEAGQRIKSTPIGAATTYGYDQAGNVITVEVPAQGKIAAVKDVYTYAGDNLRASQTTQGKTTNMVWDMAEGTPLALGDGANNYIYGPGGLPIEQINNTTSAVTYLHRDQAGSTRILTGSTGAVEGKCSYGAYGTPTCEGTAKTPLGYDAQYTNTDTGLIYLRARNYDPATGQFLSVDPLEAISGEPYAYAGDNPLTYGDSLGLLWTPLAGGAAGADAACGATFEIPGVDLGTCGAAGIASGAAALGAAVGVVTAIAGEEGGDEGEAELKRKEAERENCGNPATPPGSKFEWKGKGPVGSSEGSWWDPENDESLYPHLGENSHGPHYDYEAPDGSEYRIYPDGRIEPK